MPRKVTPALVDTPPPPPPHSAPKPLLHHQFQIGVLTVMLVIAAFIIGVLWTKVQYYEKNGVTQTAAAGSNQPTAPVLTTENFTKWASDLGLDKNKFASCLTSGKYDSNINTDQAEGTKVGITGTPGFFINGKLLIGAQPYSTFKAMIDQELASAQTSNSIANALIPQAFAQAAAPTEAARTDVTNGHLPLLGNPNAKVTIVEFSDFQCPFCLRFYKDTFGQLKKDYIDTGKVKLAYRQFPLEQLHPQARAAAIASECANEQGKFWEMHDKIFSSQ